MSSRLVAVTCNGRITPGCVIFQLNRPNSNRPCCVPAESFSDFKALSGVLVCFCCPRPMAKKNFWIKLKLGQFVEVLVVVSCTSVYCACTKCPQNVYRVAVTVKSNGQSKPTVNGCNLYRPMFIVTATVIRWHGLHTLTAITG